MNNFGLIGAAGYIAVRHLKAIQETNNNLVAALDPFDSVGIIDSYFPEADFFTEFERFDRHIYKLNREGKAVDYVSICSPNYLHDSHIRFALRQGADAICEKPLVLNPWNVEALKDYEKETGKRVYNVLQLRLHPSIIELKKKIDEGDPNKIYDVDLTYLTSRGKWYHFSWKGDVSKSGGIATNIGIHFFDMLSWIFGDVKENIVHVRTDNKAAGFIHLKRARVRWFLSVDHNDLPQEIKEKGQRTYRSIQIEGNELEFSGGFTDLHTQTYQGILDGKGFGLDDAMNSIVTAHDIRNVDPVGLVGDYHPLLKC
ncbi:MAG: Gfo/Idh/MocA family oxidoreductase [Salinivirgaceae bacterium]|jgi:UDP-N-acetyl-2-amino-2-deoxyglucuronate dehydrogenase|nr:Gfo/Idh/MocA family oxidoreductase [Salinivirgaceae bacterium]